MLLYLENKTRNSVSVIPLKIGMSCQNSNSQ